MTRWPQLAATTTVVLLAALALTSCRTGDDGPSSEKPIVIEETSDADLSKLMLSESAARRLDIQTTTVEPASGGSVVPSAAVIIDPEGVYWVYTNPEPYVFVRHRLQGVHEESQRAFFDSGPAVGTRVVVTGVPELYGAEFGIGK